MRKTEILMPAGSLEVLKTDIRYGADAVYLGGDAFGLRAGAKNFSLEEMKEGIRFAHAANVKVYVTANILARDEDIDDAEGYFEELRSIGPDAVLIADPGMFMTAKRVMPEMELHISTQANNTNSATFNFWYGLGAKRVVCARELSLAEIKRIRKSIPEDAEIEAFVHGAMCISYSGRCLLSTFMTGREANKGMCTHPCRWKYTLMEEKRPGEYFPVYENDRGTYIFNSRDLCMIEHIPELIDAGIDSLKVEGRMKTALYAATVARAYRMAVDDFKKDPELYKQNLPVYTSELEKGTYRDYTTGFFFGRPTQEGQIYDNNTYKKTYTYLGYPEEFTKEGLAL
ncbi:MAG: U32 family peptidase, partial [Lachnospiraceae bacterium]|nr:U32 family peptidase [Lachnospiraceae bacterium]